MTEGTTEESSTNAANAQYAIVINGELAVVPHQEVSYEEVVSIAFPTDPQGSINYSVTYRKAKAPNHEGILAPGEYVEVKKEGTTFDAVHSGKS